MRIALYIHFPFCVQKCLYCDFNSVAGSSLPADEYASALVKEMESRAAVLPEPATAASLYLGGGTPSLMEPHLVERILDTAARCYGLAGDAEVTIEANPGTVTATKLAGYRRAGINRLSLGIQSFDDRFLAVLGRLHSAGEARSAFAAARNAGFSNIGIDLIHSLPEQTPEQWREELAAGIALGPEHIAAYGLTVEEGTPFHEQMSQGELHLPDEEATLQMFRDTAANLADAGYEQYEISNFARQGCRSRHNQVYWQRTSYLGIGAGAHSFLAVPGYGCRWRNPEDAARYMRGIRDGHLSDEDYSRLDRREAMGEWLFLGLRLLEGIDEAAFGDSFGTSVEDTYAELPRLLQAGLLQRHGERLRLSPKGLLLYNQVVMNFL